jgi:hypothetical protein
VSDIQTMIESLTEEKNRLDFELDTALRTFAEYEEGMNVRWQTADPAERQSLMEERNQVEDQLGIVTIVIRLDEIREQLDALRQQVA